MHFFFYCNSPYKHLISHLTILTKDHRSLLFVWGLTKEAWSLWQSTAASNARKFLLLELRRHDTRNSHRRWLQIVWITFLKFCWLVMPVSGSRRFCFNLQIIVLTVTFKAPSVRHMGTLLNTLFLYNNPTKQFWLGRSWFQSQSSGSNRCWR